jgi:hypothetical protein
MVADDLLVFGGCHRAHGIGHRVFEPAIQPLPNGEVARIKGKTPRGVTPRLGEGGLDRLANMGRFR